MPRRRTKNDMSKTKILACPFCDNAMDESWHGQDPDGCGYARGCPNCKTWGPKAKTQKQADKLWNARADGRKPEMLESVGVKALAKPASKRIVKARSLHPAGSADVRDLQEKALPDNGTDLRRGRDVRSRPVLQEGTKRRPHESRGSAACNACFGAY